MVLFVAEKVQFAGQDVFLKRFMLVGLSLLFDIGIRFRYNCELVVA